MEKLPLELVEDVAPTVLEQALEMKRLGKNQLMDILQ
jgi:hypothetical protein